MKFESKQMLSPEFFPCNFICLEQNCSSSINKVGNDLGYCFITLKQLPKRKSLLSMCHKQLLVTARFRTPKIQHFLSEKEHCSYRQGV